MLNRANISFYACVLSALVMGFLCIVRGDFIGAAGCVLCALLLVVSFWGADEASPLVKRVIVLLGVLASMCLWFATAYDLAPFLVISVILTVMTLATLVVDMVKVMKKAAP